MGESARSFGPAPRPRPRRRPAVATLAVAVLLVLLAGCGSGGDPPSPHIAPLGRLGRWDGTTFVPVAAGSVTGGHLYVLVHGWAAGYRNAVDEYPGPGPLLAWYPQAVNDKGEQFTQVWLAPMASALAKLDPGATVLAFSWLDQSATNESPLAARISESRTVPNGERLGVALNQAIDPGFAARGGLVHVLGHSHGAKVAAIGALSLPTPPAQLTLFDSVDTAVPALAFADNDLVPYLRQLQIGRAPGRTFVDNYFSEFGRAYGNEPGLEAIVDVSLPPEQYDRWDFQDRHLYPPRWYTAAAEQPAAGVGPAWSPLRGNVYQGLGPYYVQQFPGDVARQLALEPGERPPPPSARTFIDHWGPQLLAAALVIVMLLGALVVARIRRRRRPDAWRRRAAKEAKAAEKEAQKAAKGRAA
jgi:hypothetical protein